MKKIPLILILGLIAFTLANGQSKKAYNYKAQKNFIPSALGKVYLGMPFKDFAGQIDLTKAEIGDTRFDWLELSIPVSKGGVEKLTVRIHGLSQEEKDSMLIDENVTKKNDLGEEYEDSIKRVKVDTIQSNGFVYAMYIAFDKDFDLKSYSIKTYGSGGEVRKPGDEYHFFDIQWNKKTPDGLQWLIRSFHEDDSRSLQLLGRIDGTEWGLDD